MSNRIQPIKFLNWLFLRIKPSEYDPSKPLTFGGGFDGTAGDNLEHLETIENNISELGDQVQGIEERIPGHITTDNPVAAISDAGKRLKNPTDTDASFCLQFGDLVICGGTVAFNNLEPGHAKEMVADLPVKMAGDYLVVCTPTADTYFDHLISEYGEKMSDMFIISCDNMGDTQATNVKVSWIAIGKKGA